MGAANLTPYTTTTRHARMKRNLAPGFCSVRSKIIEWSVGLERLPGTCARGRHVPAAERAEEYPAALDVP